MISMDMALRHMKWADDRLFREIASLPDRALTFTYADPAWNVGHILHHMVRGGEWYRYILTGAKWRELTTPTSMTELDALRVYLMEIYEVLIEECAKPDEMVEFKDEDGPNSVPRAMILSQATYHSVEHRTHIATALEVSGLKAIDLDSYDLWHYVGTVSK